MTSLRAMAVQQGFLTTAPDGSTRLRTGQTECIAAVRGPYEPIPSQRRPDKATLNVYITPTVGQGNTLYKRYEEFVAAGLEWALKTTEFPRAAIDIELITVNDDGGFPSCALNACVLACMDAGIPMKETLTACSIAIPASKDVAGVVVDPSKGDLKQSNKLALVVHFVCNRSNVLHTLAEATVEGERVKDWGIIDEVESIALKASVAQRSFMRLAQQRRYAKEISS
eukprot:Clim_evm66s210 gene=Clim_evmTU66s210